MSVELRPATEDWRRWMAERPRPGAVRLYEQVGMHVVRRNDTYEKTL